MTRGKLLKWYFNIQSCSDLYVLFAVCLVKLFQAQISHCFPVLQQRLFGLFFKFMVNRRHQKYVDLFKLSSDHYAYNV